jgi:hypothetical protein
MRAGGLGGGSRARSEAAGVVGQASQGPALGRWSLSLTNRSPGNGLQTVILINALLHPAARGCVAVAKAEQPPAVRVGWGRAS